MKYRFSVLITVLGLATFTSVSLAQVNVGGQLDIVMKNSGSEDHTNLTFRNFSNFHTSRARLFFDAAPAENVELFTQILVDDNTFQLYGAYLRLNAIGGSPLNAQMGIIPLPVGSWGPRTYADVNPLIGTPLAYNLHSTLVPGGDPIRTVDELLASRDSRSHLGLPPIYDACWNTGLEIYGRSGKLNYSVGFLSGSVSKPTVEQTKDAPQVTTHLTYEITPRLTFGGSAFYGPYLMEGAYNDTLPEGAKFNDFINAGVGYELHLTGRYVEFYSEAFYAYWEHPYLPKLEVYSGYVEGKYKFTPGWFVAGRYGFYEPGKLTDSGGAEQNWDYPVRRIEAGIGYHPNRATVMKFVIQHNDFDFTDALDSDLYALQTSVSF